ncbi:hypothetical protein GOP47_0015411 [Adiantum capillus-veneris]|uniref:Uncharacterized protein n=1 Tax=Adiantum capillus-veneris TaxID=13818 RepID=A0A9D4UJQ9_ADICA|nr:hypothetical protein GOP47_0015411 [Adiantum capillus-veneris]
MRPKPMWQLRRGLRGERELGLFLFDWPAAQSVPKQSPFRLHSPDYRPRSEMGSSSLGFFARGGCGKGGFG